MKKQGITPVDVEQVDATKADYTDIVLKFRRAARSRWPRSSTRSPTPASSRRWSARTGIRPSSEGTGQGVGERAVRLRLWVELRGLRRRLGDAGARVPRPPEHAGDAQYSTLCTRTTPVSFRALDAYTTYQWWQPKCSCRRSRTSATLPSTGRASSAPQQPPQLRQRRHHAPISTGQGPRPLHCFQWLHNSSGQWKTRPLELLG